MVSCRRERRLVPWHGASSDTFSLGTSVLSTLAETADITNLRSEAAGRTDAQQDTQKFAEAAIADSKRQGLLLAVRARWVALAVIAVTLPIINPNWDVIYYIVMLGFFALIGWAQLKVGKVGRSRPELFLIFCDLALLTLLTVVPNPLSAENWPVGMQFRFETFIYFFVFLATAHPCLFVANGGRDGLLDLCRVGDRGRLGLPAARNPRRAVGTRASRYRLRRQNVRHHQPRSDRHSDAIPGNHGVPDRRHDVGAGGAPLQRPADQPRRNRTRTDQPRAVFFAQCRRAIVWK